MIPHNTRGNRKSRIDTINAEMEIRRLMDDNDSDAKIMNRLQMSRSTYYRRKSRIYRQDKEIWLQLTQESVESRALNLMRSLQDAYEINKKIAEDETNPDTRARIQASQVMVMTQGHMLKLTIEGPNINSYLADRANNGDRGHLIVLKPKGDNIQEK